MATTNQPTLLRSEHASSLHALNNAYNEKFGFPFIVAVRGHSRSSILDLLERRLQNDGATEMRESLQQIYRIALLRLQDTVEEN